jgi:two-component system nitrogen regulation response regulator GlnG
LLYKVVEQQLITQKAEIAKEIIANVESILIKAALAHTAGKRYEAALLLGYGRNTLTRKIQELNLEPVSK